MGGTDAGEALGLGFDHGAEAVVAPRALLLDVGVDGLQVFVRHCVLEKRSIGHGASGV